MKRGKVDYSTPDTIGWQKKSDDLFLARYRGNPCEICGKRRIVYQGRPTRSCGHHIAEKDLHRIHRYEPRNIVVLCAEHHGQHNRVISPHSDDTVAVAAFYYWLWTKKPEQWKWLTEHARDKWDGGWTYKEMYQELGGRIKGEFFENGKPILKTQKPDGHAEVVRNIEETNNQGERK